MGVFSGKYGNVATASGSVTSVSNWTVSETNNLFSFSASNTKSGKARSSGIYDYTGSFEGFGLPPLMPGTVFQFKGYTAPNDPSVAATGEAIESGAEASIVENVRISWDWSQASLLMYTLNFANATGAALTRNATSTQLDTTNFNSAAVTVCGPDIFPTYGASNTEWNNVLTATLDITSNNLTYVNSSTDCGTARLSGVVDATLGYLLKIARGLKIGCW